MQECPEMTEMLRQVFTTPSEAFSRRRLGTEQLLEFRVGWGLMVRRGARVRRNSALRQRPRWPGGRWWASIVEAFGLDEGRGPIKWQAAPFCSDLSCASFQMPRCELNWPFGATTLARRCRVVRLDWVEGRKGENVEMKTTREHGATTGPGDRLGRQKSAKCDKSQVWRGDRAAHPSSRGRGIA